MTLIPLNMAQPIIIAEHREQSDGSSLGFAPHGAGRNMSRTKHIKRLAEEFGEEKLSESSIRSIVGRETSGLDVRFYNGLPDVSKLPSAYKNAQQVTAQIEKHGLATIANRIWPIGSIMAGEISWR